ncbi:MAG TPA: FtsX-like permease family protein, partial [Candidatus Angelobacter sp.]|nr:FtsX-like permease family protein [Candidatus Angelobacter sp.]
GVLTFELTMTGHKYDTPQAVIDTYHQLWERLEHLPGANAAGGVTSLPLSGTFAWGPITVEGRVPPPGENFINADQRIAGGDYFQAMQIPLRKGRFFNEQDTYTNPRAVVVDEYMAQELWPNQDPLGKRIHYGGAKEDAPWLTVVGVVGRVKQYALDADSRIAFYFPQTQFRTRAIDVVVRSSTDPSALTAAVRNAIHSLDPDLPIYRVRTMAQCVDESLARRRFSMVLLGLFAGLALVLATIGIYGVIAYLVSQGTREIGIRIALGADKKNILGLVVRQGMTLALVGVAIGLAASFILTRFMSSLLFGVNATDALTFTAIPLLLTLVALTASYVPARRAAGIDPMIALRCE